ncbi:MAG: hypothetical protein QOJ00_1017, partial [Actinomycetota bacterium]
MGTLDGNVALVTGGGSGIGYAVARRLKDEGASIVVVDRNGDAAEEAATEFGGRAITMDVGRPSDWDIAVSSVRAHEGGLDLVHLNAGVTTGESDLTKLTEEQYRRIMGANVDGVVWGMKATLPLLAERGGGRIVATASLAGVIAFSNDPIYALTKHAVVGLVRSAALQWADQGIVINAICPGIVDTPLPGEQAKKMLKAANFPLIEPDEVAQAVYELMTTGEPGAAHIIQAGTGGIPYRFHNV